MHVTPIAAERAFYVKELEKPCFVVKDASFNLQLAVN